MGSDHDLLTANEVAGYLRVHRSTVIRWSKDGTLAPALKLGSSLRFRREDVEKMVAAALREQPESAS